MQTIRILMTDDHPMIIEGYKNTLLSTKKENHILDIDIASNCDEALHFIEKAGKATDWNYDVLFFDISIPPSSDGVFLNGEDLAKHTRIMLPQAKIIMLTMFDESFRIHNIINTINPEGLLIKSDITFHELSSAFQAVLANPPFYSGTVHNLLKKSSEVTPLLDITNRKILMLLSQGVKTKNLVEHLDISLSAIEKRKKKIKEDLNIEGSKDDMLLKVAKEKGLI